MPDDDVKDAVARLRADQKRREAERRSGLEILRDAYATPKHNDPAKTGRRVTRQASERSKSPGMDGADQTRGRSKAL